MSAPSRRDLWGVGLAALLAAGILVLALSCGSPSGTAAYVQVDFPDTIQATQLRFTVDDGADTLLAAKVLPAQAADAALTSGQTVRFLLPDAAGGKTVAVAVEGLAQGAVVARGRGQAMAVTGEEVKIPVTLAPIAAACDAQSCPQGCCQNGACVTELTATVCGQGGQACGVCDPNVADGCGDGGCTCGSGPACAAGEACQDGKCVCQGSGCGCVAGACTTPGACESGPGTCDAGTCSYPAKAAGDACDDGHACTQSDVCDASGTCAGTAKECGATANTCLQGAGTCDPASGQCSYAPKASGTACDDGNACTQNETCDGSGTCGSGAVTVCNTPPDDCHEATGTCGTDGACVYALKSAGSTCDDGDACTTGDVCGAGGACAGTPKSCAASDQCHTAGTCDPDTGTCSNPAKANGATCSDGNACTQGDTCQSGACQSGAPKTCSASDQCHTAGTCNTTTGVCSNPAEPNGTTCNDGNACTTTDRCQSGVCQSGTAKTCTAKDQCHTAGTCSPSTGNCSNPIKSNGTTCNDGNACTQTDICQSGNCTGGNLKACNSPNQCQDAPGTCNTGTGACSYPPKASGTTCNDFDSCTLNSTCDGSGLCLGNVCPIYKYPFCCPGQGCVGSGTSCN
jgi:hypothetical protein